MGTGGTIRGVAAALAAALVPVAAPAVAHAATIAVTTTDDALAADGNCSLREAVSAANTDSTGPGHDCTKGDGADRIELAKGTYKLTRAGAGEDANSTGDLDLGSDITIVGASLNSTAIDGNHLDRVLQVLPGRTVTIRDLTIRGGRAPAGADGAPVTGTAGQVAKGLPGADGAPGGGIFNDGGTLTIVDAELLDNVAGAGGAGGPARGADGAVGTTGGRATDAVAATGGRGGDGGGVFTTGALTLTRVFVAANAAGAGGSGGAATGGGGGASPAASGGVGGDAGVGSGGIGGVGGSGGGVAERGGGSLTVEESTFAANRAGSGGTGGTGTGGIGGGTGADSGAGGRGGLGEGNNGGPGGAGGALWAADAVVLTGDLIAQNHAGDGGQGGDGHGGAGGPTTGTGSQAGEGGNGAGDLGGGGGSGGGIETPAGSIVNVTIWENGAGQGGRGGDGIGGAGGPTVGGTAGNGGRGEGAAGGAGGIGGGLVGSMGSVPQTLTVKHATIAENFVGIGSLQGGSGTGGPGGKGGGGAAGGATNGARGTTGSGANFTAGFAGTRLANSIVYTDGLVASCFGPLADGGHNVSYPDASCPGVHVDPEMAQNAEDNGGPTKTLALAAASPAVDLVPATGAGCPDTDQRGVIRPNGPACDAGAYEHAPPNVATRPATAVSDHAATLRGTVNSNARDTQYHFELGTTGRYGLSTDTHRAPSGTSAAPVDATVTGLAPGTTYHYRLVATNADGDTATADATFTTASGKRGGGGGGGSDHGSGGGPGTAPRHGRPALRSLSVRPARFRVGRGRHHGTTFRFRLSEPARVRFAFRRLGGRRHGHHHHRRRLLAGAFTARFAAGRAHRRFSGKVHGRALKPGRYRVTLTATDRTGNRSKPARARFRVVRRHR